MSPQFTMNYFVYMCIPKIEKAGDACLTHAIFPKLAYFNYLFIRYCGMMVLFTYRLTFWVCMIAIPWACGVVAREARKMAAVTNSDCRPAFINPILRIFLLCSQPQVFRVATQPIVASMAYAQAIGNRAYGKLISGAMRSHGMAINRDFSIAANIFCALPLPALINANEIGKINTLLKNISTFFCGILTRHSLPTSEGEGRWVFPHRERQFDFINYTQFCEALPCH